jgi:hypothetical protein
MTLIAGFLAKVAASGAWAWFGKLMSGFGTAAAAFFAAIPALLDAVTRFFEALSKNALMAFVIAGLVFGACGFLYGVSLDKDIRARDKARAIATANANADRAIAAIRADYEKRLADLRARMPRTAAKR